MTNRTPNSLSNREKAEVTYHLNIALAVFLVISLLVILLGFFKTKPIITLMGAIFALLSTLGITILAKIENKKQIEKLKGPIILQLNFIKEAYVKAEKSLLPIDEMRKNKTTTLVDSKSSTSLNILSLERLLETLGERLVEIENLISTNRIGDIEKANELLETNLHFTDSASSHLLEHHMPDMPPSTWVDSLNFLLNKVNEDVKIFNLNVSSSSHIKVTDKTITGKPVTDKPKY